MRFEDDELFDRLLADQSLIKLPLVRIGNNVAVGAVDKTWKEMLSSDG